MGVLNKLMFGLVSLGLFTSIIVNVFSVMTLYTQGDTLIRGSAKTVDIAAGMGYIMYVLALVLINMVVVGFSVFLLNYKLYTYEKFAEEDEDE
jgi:hypothetical protein